MVSFSALKKCFESSKNEIYPPLYFSQTRKYKDCFGILHKLGSDFSMCDRIRDTGSTIK